MGASNNETVISELVNGILKSRTQLQLLEAGCGSASYFEFNNICYTTGIDISQKQLDRNQVLQKKILGDLQVYDLPSNEYDIIVCWDVIEHLSRPRDALLNMFRALKPGGVIVLGFPNLMSFKGIATKITPHWFHEYFYRKMNYEFRPFPTYLRVSVLPDRVINYAKKYGFEVVFKKLHEGGVTARFKKRYIVFRIMFNLVDYVVRTLSLGRCNSLYLDNCALILQKQRS